MLENSTGSLAANPRNYKSLKELSRKTGLRIPDLLAMSSNNDPFYIQPAQVKQAEWFAALWKRFSLSHGVHLRRIHYRLVSQAEPVVMLDGKPYENTMTCWQYLGNASKAARILRLVDPTAFIDARNPSATINLFYDSSERDEPKARFDTLDDWNLPEIFLYCPDGLTWKIPEPEISEYEYNDLDRPFHLEIISEKSTADDILIPMCGRLGVNYAPATGFQSITGVISLLQRIAKSGKPGVIFYISDFDPAGSFMPPSVARQIEYWRQDYAPGLDVLLKPIVLTREQVLKYNLPPIPIKETDKRQNNFLERYGVQGATELDALESLHPGELRKIIIDAAVPYLDSEIRQRIRQAGDDAAELAREAWLGTVENYVAPLKRLASQAREIAERYQERVDALQQAMEADLAPVRDGIESLRRDIKTAMEEFDPDLPEHPRSELTLPGEFDGLFDSRRNYLAQLAYYKATGTIPCGNPDPAFVLE